MLRTFLLAGAAVPCLLLAMPARAQTRAPARSDARIGDEPVASWTGDIIVTGTREGYSAPDASGATRTDTPLIEIPQSVQVITRSLIREQDRRTLADALVNVSGVVPNRPEEGLLAGPIVRGFLAEIYQDGLPMYGSTQAANDPTSLVGIDRIEVLKGPSSTLYGGGVGAPLGGLISIQSTRPSETPGGFVALRAGSFATVNPYGEINVPLTSGIAARIAAEYQRNDHWIDRVGGERIFVQPGISFRIGTRTDLWLQGQYSRREQLEYSGLPAEQALAGDLDRDAFPGAPNGQPRTRTESWMATAMLRHAFTDDVKLTVSGRYFDSRVPQYGSFVFPGAYPPDPATPSIYPILSLNMLTKWDEKTADANLMAKADVLGGRHTFLAGVGYDDTDFYSDMGFAGRSVGAIDLADPGRDLSWGSFTPPTLFQTDRYETMAAYVQDQASYGSLHLTGSLRYTRLKFREDQQATNETYHRVSPRIGATFDLAPGIAIYAGHATAFRGAFGLVTLRRPRPETSSNVEAGMKVALPAIGLTGTLAAFRQRRDNVATPDPANPLFYSVQTGRQRARGIEADVTWEPTPAFSLIANYAHTDAEVTKDNSPALVGDRLPRVPEHGGRVAARYRVLDGDVRGLSLGAGITAFTARELTLPNGVSVPGYAVIDAQAAYDVGRFTIQVSAANLGGRRAYDTYQYFAFPVVLPIQPRSAFVTIKARI